MVRKKYPKGHRLYSSYFLQVKRGRANWKISLKKRKRPDTKKGRNGLFHTVSAPRLLSLFHAKDHRKTCLFLEEVLSLSSSKPVLIDFSKTDVITAHASLLLYSVIEEVKDDPSRTSVRLRIPRNAENIRKIVQRSGIHSLVYGVVHKSNDSLPIVSANCSELSNGRWEDVLDFIDKEVIKGGFAPEEEQRFGGAISEAVMNVLHHAYPSHHKEGKYVDMRWWMICEVIDSDLYLAILDRGVGIPETLPEQSWFKDKMSNSPNTLKKLLGSGSRDSKWIRVSMIKGESSTKRPERGLGGPTILGLIEEGRDESLYIFSNKGIYGRTKAKVNYASDSRSSINGTIVQWNIRLRDDHRDQCS